MEFPTETDHMTITRENIEWRRERLEEFFNLYVPESSLVDYLNFAAANAPVGSGTTSTVGSGSGTTSNPVNGTRVNVGTRV